jgi:hypothetical protein
MIRRSLQSALPFPEHVTGNYLAGEQPFAPTEENQIPSTWGGLE